MLDPIGHRRQASPAHWFRALPALLFAALPHCFLYLVDGVQYSEECGALFADCAFGAMTPVTLTIMVLYFLLFRLFRHLIRARDLCIVRT